VAEQLDAKIVVSGANPGTKVSVAHGWAAEGALAASLAAV
jgi:hypothetical protein